MENPCKIICFGDSLTRNYHSLFKEKFHSLFSHINTQIINHGISGETSRDGLKRINDVLKENPDVVVIGFGMNDKYIKISSEEFYQNLIKIIDAFEKEEIRVLLLNLHPTCKNDDEIGEINEIIKKVICKTRIRLVDIYSYWTEEFKNPEDGLRDGVHQSRKGNEVYCKALLQTVPRRNTVVLWAYNGNPCECNYKCPYCQYAYLEQKGNKFSGTIDQWHKAFKNSFGNQHVTFYFGHGEPMIGEKFFDVVEMIGRESNWEMRIISNLSGDLKRLVNTRVAKEGRLNINGSFHPTMISTEKFLEKLLFLRKHKIEVPVVYVMWPPFIKRFEKDFELFDKHNFLIHIRRFRGVYKGKCYPKAYTDKEMQFVARYCDDATIKYMLNEESTTGKVSYTGMTLVFVDELGNISYCDDVRTFVGNNFGNILKGNINLLNRPIKFKPKNISDSTVDGVTNIAELNYDELEGNHILHFAKQGEVYHTPNGVYYKNLKVNFNDPKMRAIYNFPLRNIKDLYYVIKIKGIRYFIKKHPLLFNIAKQIYSVVRKK